MCQYPTATAVLGFCGRPSQSWFAANKYVLGALLVVAIVIARDRLAALTFSPISPRHCFLR